MSEENNGEQQSAGMHEAKWTSSDYVAAQPQNKGKSSAFRSVRFQTWMYFFLLAALVLFVLWLFQILFFKSAYRTMKKQSVEHLGMAIASKYPGADNADYDAYIKEKAFLNGLNIVIFRVKEEGENCTAEEAEFYPEYVAGQLITNPEKDVMTIVDKEIIFDWDRFYPAVRDDGKASYIERTSFGNYFVFGTEIENSENCYLYITSPHLPLENTSAVMTDQLILTTVVCLVFSVVVAWFISDRITKPITEFSRLAKKMGSGDFGVRFNGNGYTEIENLADSLNYAMAELDKTEQMRRDFLANVSHDLRTPLTMVKAYAEMIRDISGSDEVKRNQHSQVIIDEADRLTELVNDILNLSKLQSDTESLTLENVDMRVMTKTVIERFDMYAMHDGYNFEFTSCGDCTVRGDSKRLEQVIYNLVGNAISHTGDNKTVRIKTERNGGKVRVSVRDFGDGIAPEELDKVWERYYRAGQNKRNVVGSGLGLSIVKSILCAHGAAYGVSSELGAGTEFWFELTAFDEAEVKELPPPDKHKKRTK